MSESEIALYRSEFTRLFSRTTTPDDIVEPEDAGVLFDRLLALNDFDFLGHVADRCTLAGICQPERGQAMALLVAYLISARLLLVGAK